MAGAWGTGCWLGTRLTAIQKFNSDQLEVELEGEVDEVGGDDVVVVLGVEIGGLIGAVLVRSRDGGGRHAVFDDSLTHKELFRLRTQIRLPLCIGFDGCGQT